jgi:hypothetical protein
MFTDEFPQSVWDFTAGCAVFSSHHHSSRARKREHAFWQSMRCPEMRQFHIQLLLRAVAREPNLEWTSQPESYHYHRRRAHRICTVCRADCNDARAGYHTPPSTPSRPRACGTSTTLCGAIVPCQAVSSRSVRVVKIVKACPPPHKISPCRFENFNIFDACHCGICESFACHI